MNEAELILRTKQFALRTLRLVDALPKTTAGRAVGGQLVRCAMSVAANYRAACRGRSRAEFVAKLGVVEEEADESGFWLEMISDAKLLRPNLVAALLRESGELTAIMAASRMTARRRAAAIANRKSKIANS